MQKKTPQNPCRKATARVKNPLPVPDSCQFCKAQVRIATHQEVYGKDFSDWPYLYLCGNCGAYVGMHPLTNIPLGTLADRATREARKKCKKPFEIIWRSGLMSRTEAYHWLAREMDINVSACHFGWFDIGQCEEAYRACKKLLEDLNG
ncbi:zinc-finger-containing protein [Pantoea stewartii]|uniref:zinc-finger-containing protein n=1 Tax=Pantoea stewartii TaxID=66269 RepID=UPI0033693AF2